MLKKIVSKKEGKGQPKINDNMQKDVELSEEQLDHISGGIAPIMIPKDDKRP